MQLQANKSGLLEASSSHIESNVLCEINKLLQMELTSSQCITCRRHLSDFSASEHKPNLGSVLKIIEVHRSGLELPRLPSSDSQILKNVAKDINPQKNLERLNQLEQDVTFVRSQLCGLKKNKSSTANIINELQASYKHLLKKNERQEKEIQSLKYENKKLLKQRRRTCCDEELKLVNVKKYLELCENKLSKLDMTMVKLLKSYQNSKDNEVKYEMENRELVKINNELKNTIINIINQLEEFSNNSINVGNLREEQNNNCGNYPLELSKTEEFTSDTTTNALSKVEKIAGKENETVTMQKIMESKLHVFEEITDGAKISASEEQTAENKKTIVNEYSNLANKTDGENENQCDNSERNVEKPASLPSSECMNTCSGGISINSENLIACISSVEEEEFEALSEVEVSKTRICDNEEFTDNPNSFLPTLHYPVYEDYELECFCESCEEY